jgi:nitrate reductase delta subunit
VVAAVCSLLDPLTAEQEAQARQIAKDGPPMETVGLEPFAPPDVMPLVPGELRR